jgi:hypothetical protein
MADRIGHGVEIRRLYKIFGEKAVALVDAVKGGCPRPLSWSSTRTCWA